MSKRRPAARTLMCTCDLGQGELLPEERPELLVALLGNPNVGKSTLFNQVTGAQVATAHYAGKTADVHVGDTLVGDVSLGIVDLPGTYVLGTDSDEQAVARRVLFETAPDAVVVVLDATNLPRNLSLALQVLDLGMPTVFALNLVDEAESLGVHVDATALAEGLGAPVFPIAAADGVGVSALLEYAVLLATGQTRPDVTPPRYADAVSAVLVPLQRAIEADGAAVYSLSARALALELLEGRDDIEALLRAAGEDSTLRVAEEARTALAALAGEPPEAAVRRARRDLANRIGETVTSEVDRGVTWRRRLATLATRPATGVPILLLALLGTFGLLFVVGGLLAEAVAFVWETAFSPVVNAIVIAVFGQGPVGRTMLWGFDAGLEASLSIGIPYILTFYFLLSVLEDSGYLNAVAFLADRVMHRVGLHGRAIIPIAAGLGCSVPAVLGTRILPTRREQVIAATLVSMVPCSARTAVIMGAVGHYVGFLPALATLLVAAVVTGVVGFALDRMMGGQTHGMVMEMFPFRTPSLRVVVRKSWSQFREFLFVATPLVIAGSLVLGGLYESGWLTTVANVMEPVVEGLLGLPPAAGLTLLFGLLRKEFALQMLVTFFKATGGTGADLSDFMTPVNIFVYTLVNTLAMPCISTIAVLGRTLGWRTAAQVLGITVGVALLIGAFFARVLPLFGLS